MAIIKRSLGNNSQVMIRYFREEYGDGLGGLAYRAFCDGWQCAWKECIAQSPKLKNKRIEELEKALEIIGMTNSPKEHWQIAKKALKG